MIARQKQIVTSGFVAGASPQSSNRRFDDPAKVDTVHSGHLAWSGNHRDR